MAERAPSPAPERDRPAEVVRLNKIISSLMDRAERNTSVQGSDFSVFQTAIMLEEQVRRRTAELEKALQENEKVNRALRESEAKFRGLVSQSMVGIVLIEDGKFTYSNAKFDEIFGYSASEVRKLGPLQTAIESDRALVAENTRRRLSGEVDELNYTFRGLRKDRTVLNIECHSSVMRVGTKPILISLILDITERTRVEAEVQCLQERLREESTHDSLTGLYNRRFLEDSLARELSLAERSGRPLSVIMGDLDHFKVVNDRHGHLAGDDVLRVVGALMKDRTRASDISCRFGGEEFLLVLPGMGREGAVERAEQLRHAIAAVTVLVGAAQVPITASFGVATFPVNGRTGDELVAAADEALYAAKAGGRNRVDVAAALHEPTPPGQRPPPDTAPAAEATLCRAGQSWATAETGRSDVPSRRYL